MRTISVVLLTLGLCSAVPTETTAGDFRPVHTYSIVARDEVTGQMGVAVQSHWFSVGSVVTWAEAGVGAVATQSFAEPAYGPRGLALMKSGLSPEQSLEALLSADAGEAVRQVAFVDDEGNVAAHTGSKCIEYASHHTGDGYSVQANMMLTDLVVPAMARAYESTHGDLASRLLAALKAAQDAGGDIRGRQSAAILIVKGEATGQPFADRVLEIRIEDHQEPLMELERLLNVHRAYDQMNRGDVAIEKGDFQDAEARYREAARLAPGNPEVLYWHAVTLATNGKVDESIPLFREIFAQDENWIDLTRRLQKPEIIPNTPEGRTLVEEIIRRAR